MHAYAENAGVLLQMPPELHYLIAPALCFGCRTEWDVYAFLDNATGEQIQELAVVAESVMRSDHYPAVVQFLGAYPITEYEECAKLYFFFGILDHGGLQFDGAPGPE